MRTCRGKQCRTRHQVSDSAPHFNELLPEHADAVKSDQATQYFSPSIYFLLPEWAPLCCQTLTPEHSSHQSVWWGTRRAFQRPDGGRQPGASPAGRPALSAADWRSGGKFPECAFWPLSPRSAHQHITVLRKKMWQNQSWITVALGGLV